MKRALGRRVIRLVRIDSYVTRFSLLLVIFKQSHESSMLILTIKTGHVRPTPQLLPTYPPASSDIPPTPSAFYYL